jgi:hypothetical protein
LDLVFSFGNLRSLEKLMPGSTTIMFHNFSFLIQLCFQQVCFVPSLIEKQETSVWSDFRNP